MGPPAGSPRFCSSTATFPSMFLSYLVNLLELFSVVYKLWWDAVGKGSWEIRMPGAGPVTDLSGPLSSAHLGNISLNLLCFLAPAQMVYIWEKSTAKLWDSGEHLANNFPVWRLCYYEGVLCVHRNNKLMNCSQMGPFRLGKTPIKEQ